jgi:NAD(P)-dependent dehydrogenase (short-subunit alcohol dehydrogenase family)
VLTMTCRSLILDLAEPSAPEQLAEQAWAACGGLDVLLNNAGISYPERVENPTSARLDDVLNVNLRAPSLLAARIGTAMAKAGSGSIINMASAAGLRALEEHYVYCMTKAALLMATKVLVPCPSGSSWGPPGYEPTPSALPSR